MNQAETQSGTEETSTGTEETLTLREELTKQLNEQTEEVTDDANTPEQKTEEVTEGEESDEQEGEEVAKEVESKEKIEVSDTDVPNNWNEEEKKAFEDIPDEIVTQDGTKISLKAMKDVVLHRNEELLKSFMEKSREVKAAEKGSKEWNNLLDPYQSQLKAAGMEPQKWIGLILQSVHALQQNPKAVIKDLIGTYKVSASDLGFKTEQSEDEDDFHSENDPKVTKLETTIDDLQRRLDSFENAGVQRDNKAVQDEIAVFKAETDANGNLTHPYFDEARDEMGILMQTGKAKTLQDAYEDSPTVRSKGLEVVKNPEKDKLALKKAREEAAKAKKAGKTVKTRSGQSNNFNQGLSLREELQKGLRAQG